MFWYVKFSDFLYFHKSFCEFTRNRPKNGRKTENCFRYLVCLSFLVCHYRKNVAWDFFLKSDVKLRKNTDCGQFQTLFTHLNDFTKKLWKLDISKNDSKKSIIKS
jgi:hypothetical protein